MNTCKKTLETADMLCQGGHAGLNIDVTRIVKYVSFAGVAIVGIIFFAKSYIASVRAKAEAATKDE